MAVDLGASELQGAGGASSCGCLLGVALESRATIGSVRPQTKPKTVLSGSYTSLLVPLTNQHPEAGTNNARIMAEART